MIEGFDTRYARIHAEIQQNVGLVKRLYDGAIALGLREKRVKGGSGRNKTYFPFETFKNIPLGVDLSIDHVHLEFEHILARMRLIHEESKGTIDLLRVYVILGCEDSCGGGVAIVSEDVSRGSRYRVLDRTSGLNFEKEKSAYKILEKIFEPRGDIDKAIFGVFNGEKLIRSPVVDLDHLSVKPEYRERHTKYTRQYYSDKRFFLPKP